MIQGKLKQILLTQKVIAKQGVFKLAEQFNSLNNQRKDVHLIPKCLSNANQEISLKFELLISNNKSKDTTIKESWIVCSLGEYNQIDISISKGIFIINESDGHIEIQQFGKYVFIVKTLKQALAIAAVNDQQLHKRDKLQKMLRNSQKKYTKNQSALYLLNLSNGLLHNFMRNQVRQLVKFLNFSGKWRLKALRKFFTYWSISYYQAKISKIQKQIISQEYLIQHSNKKLKQKFFKAWKLIKKKCIKQQT